MNRSSTQKIVIGGAVLILVAFFIYSFFIQGGTPVSGVTSIQNREVIGEDILVLVDKLKRISIDKSIFSSALFSNLKDFSVNIYPESQGRPNPFALVGNDGGSQNNSSTTSQKKSSGR